jgi:hypothetical protein
MRWKCGQKRKTKALLPGKRCGLQGLRCAEGGNSSLSKPLLGAKHRDPTRRVHKSPGNHVSPGGVGYGDARRQLRVGNQKSDVGA